MAPVKPKRRQCGSMEAHERLAELHSSFRTNQNRIESFTRTEHQVRPGRARGAAADHGPRRVVSKKAEEDVSDSQIKSQIAVLNKDFRATNADATDTPSVWSGLVADANGGYVETAIGPTDRPEEVTGAWTSPATTRSW